ncbi:hypothetical protein MKEN_01017900 [Mycena kentingensis (nom. inval.)]|nr:hypothetical protein MKEN_01017900 [Mycena kentingensis (nom. inval.)]
MPTENENANATNEQLVVDAITTNMGIPGSAADVRLFYSMVQNGPTPMGEVFTTALIFKLLDVVRIQDTKIDALTALVQQLIDAAGAAITSDRSLMAEINAAGKTVVIQAGRIQFDNNSLAQDMRNELRSRTINQLLLGLLDPNVQGSTASERNLRQALGFGASYGKQYARRQIIATMNTSLSSATRTMSLKLLGHDDRITVPFMLRILHMRGFGRENEDLLAQEDDTPPADTNDENQGAQPRKRKKKPAVGGDFFAAFEADLSKKNKEWDADYKAAGWVNYLADLVVYERKRFTNDVLKLLPDEYKAKANEPPAAHTQVGNFANMPATPFASSSQASNMFTTSSPAWPNFTGLTSFNS